MNRETIPKWFQKYVDRDARNWILQDGIFRLVQDGWESRIDAHSFYNTIGGVEQGRLAQDPKHASYYDRPRYEELISKTIASSEKPLTLALDLGCGDGRCTRMLLDNGVPHIIAVDFHLPSLYRLSANLTQIEQERVVLVWAPVTIEPIGNVFCDVVICVEVLTTLSDPEVGRDALFMWGKIGCKYLVVEPAVEGSLIYALIDNKLSTLKDIAVKSCRYDTINGHSLKVHLHTKRSLFQFMTKGQFKILEEYQVPANAALSLFSFKKNMQPIGPEELALVEMINGLESSVPRMHAIIGSK